MINRVRERNKKLIATLKALPKIDLHRHLEGSLRLSTLATIAEQHGIDLHSYEMEDLRPLVQVVDDTPNFQEFLAKFAVLRKFYSSREAISRIAYEAVSDAAADHIRYLELRFNPVALANQKDFTFEEVTDWVITSVNKAQKDCNITVRLIIQMGRHEPQFASHLVEIAIANQDKGIVGVDLAGDEEHFTAEKFINVMLKAKEEGLYITAHAGECANCPAANVYEAIEVIHADRIGHGVHSKGDPRVLDLLYERQIALEMCPTSNLQTGSIESFWGHPMTVYQSMGIPVTINTDDPSVSNITLSDEYIVVNQAIGVDFETLKKMIINAAQAAFLPAEEKQVLVDWFSKSLANYKLEGY
ncbi:MAG: adenosine deaminase [Chloroflexota bacterium]